MILSAVDHGAGFDVVNVGTGAIPARGNDQIGAGGGSAVGFHVLSGGDDGEFAKRVLANGLSGAGSLCAALGTRTTWSDYGLLILSFGGILGWHYIDF